MLRFGRDIIGLAQPTEKLCEFHLEFPSKK